MVRSGVKIAANVSSAASCGFAIFAIPSYAAAPAVNASLAIQVPFVGCASDGQLGFQSAPKEAKPTPSLPPAVADRLAYYVSMDFGVLAPRGWNCFSVYGSSGSTVFVTPDPIDTKHIFNPDFRFKGKIVEFRYTLGGTSGRFGVAQVAARLFPVASDFVNRVADEEKQDAIPFPLSRRPFRDDKILTRSDTVVRFETPPRSKGLGTAYRIAPSGLPIQGIAILVNDDARYPDLIELNIRLPNGDAKLIPAIQGVVESNHGAPLSDSSLNQGLDQ